MRNSISNSFLTVALAFVMFSCGEDSEPRTEQIDIHDPNAVAINLSFKNGTVTSVTENLPGPSADTGAPVLSEDSEDSYLAISGGKLSIEFRETTGAVLKGAYVQVKGANHYDNIAFHPSTTGGRIFGRKNTAINEHLSTRLQNQTTLLMGIPESLEPGTFCLSLAVYDTENRMSNVIEACIEVKSAGGDDAAFLTAHAWALESTSYIRESNSGEISGDTVIVGELEKRTFTTYMYCNGANQAFTVNTESRLNYVHATFSPDGSVVMENSEYTKYRDLENSSCEAGIMYEVRDPSLSQTPGYWAYNADSKELSLVQEYSDENEDGSTTVETRSSVFNLSQEDGKLILTRIIPFDGGSYNETTIFIPKEH